MLNICDGVMKGAKTKHADSIQTLLFALIRKDSTSGSEEAWPNGKANDKVIFL